MQTILEASVRAATASQRQSYATIDNDRMEWLANRRDAVLENKDMTEYHSGIIDTVLAAQTAVVAARSLGIYSVIHHSMQVKDMDAFYEQLALPRHKGFHVMTIVLGYDREEPAIKKGRLTTEGIVQHNAYKPFDDEAQDRIIASYDVKEDHMDYIVNWEEKGYAQRMRCLSAQSK